jgi:hypothetical protein
MPTVTITPTKGISILLPTRDRAAVSFNSLKTLVETADNVDNVEFLVAIDNDDDASAQYYQDTVVPWFEEQGIDLTVYQVPRWGYGDLNQYINYLGMNSVGSWLIFWNDDAKMISQGWDTEVLGHTGEFSVLRFHDNHNDHPYAIFPIVPRDWLILFETLSPQQQTDAWISQVAYLADAVERLTSRCIHDRADLTGNNDDTVYQTRVYHEGNPDNPKDINYPSFHVTKQQWAIKLVWIRKLLGQDTGYWDRVSRGEIDPWTRMLENDPNKQIAVTKIPKEKFQQMGL